MQLETQRLILRPAHEVTPQAIFEAVGESMEAFKRFLFWVQDGYTMADAEAFVAMARKGWETQNDLVFAACARTTGKLVCTVGLKEDKDPSSPRVPFYTVGWWCRTPMAGRGYTAEAAEVVISHAFSVRGARRVDATAHIANTPSIRVMEKLGMVREGILKNSRRNFWDGNLSDTVLYAMYPAEGLFNHLKG